MVVINCCSWNVQTFCLSALQAWYGTDLLDTNKTGISYSAVEIIDKCVVSCLNGFCPGKM